MHQNSKSETQMPGYGSPWGPNDTREFLANVCFLLVCNSNYRNMTHCLATIHERDRPTTNQPTWQHCILQYARLTVVSRVHENYYWHECVAPTLQWRQSFVQVATGRQVSHLARHLAQMVTACHLRRRCQSRLDNYRSRRCLLYTQVTRCSTKQPPFYL